MKVAVELVDRLLERVPVDSHYGRQMRSEILEHLEESVTERLEEPDHPLPEALDDAVASFGKSAALERDFYADYVRARYWLGWLDRETFLFPDRMLLRTGQWLLLLGFAFFCVLPTIVHFSRFFSLANLASSAPPGAAEEIVAAIPPSIASLEAFTPWWLGGWPWAAVLIAGIAAFCLATLRISRAARLIDRQGRAIHAIFLLLPAAALGFALTADPSRCSGALNSHITGFTSWAQSAANVVVVTRPVTAAFLVGVGLVLVTAIAAVGLFLAARRQLRADTVALRHAALGVLLACIGLLLITHPVLIDLHREITAASAIDNEPVPRRLAGGIQLDFLAFLLGACFVTGAIRVIHNAVLEIHRTTCARRRGVVRQRSRTGASPAT